MRRLGLFFYHFVTQCARLYYFFFHFPKTCTRTLYEIVQTLCVFPSLNRILPRYVPCTSIWFQSNSEPAREGTRRASCKDNVMRMLMSCACA